MKKRFVEQKAEDERAAKALAGEETVRGAAQLEAERDERGVAMAARRSIMDGVPSEDELRQPERSSRRGVIAPSERRPGLCDICGKALENDEREEAEHACRPETLCRDCRKWRRYSRVGSAYNLDPSALPSPNAAE